MSKGKDVGTLIGKLPAGSTIIRQAGPGDLHGNPKRVLMIEHEGEVFWLRLDGTRELLFKRPIRAPLVTGTKIV